MYSTAFYSGEKKKAGVNLACVYLCISLLDILFARPQVSNVLWLSGVLVAFFFQLLLFFSCLFYLVGFGCVVFFFLVFSQLFFGGVFGRFWFGFFFTHFDIAFECALWKTEKEHCRDAEGTKQCPVPGEYVLICVPKTSRCANSSYSFLTETFPSAAFSCNTKGPVTLQAVRILKKPFGKACQTLRDSSLWGFHCKFGTLW